METKTYFASSVPAALEVARQELGDNAMLVNSRPAPSEMRNFGRLEVTFAFDRPAFPPRVPQKPAAPADLDDIRQQLSDLRSALGRGGEKTHLTAVNPDNSLAARLVSAGLSSETAAEIVAGASVRPGDRDSAALAELTHRIPVSTFSELQSGETRTLAFVGAPGRGKTTSLVKLAFHLGIARRVPVRIYCAGAHAIGGQEQLARYASILGTPFQAFENLAGLNLALNGESWKGLILIDTPGLSPAETTELADLKTFFAHRQDIQTHLVLRSDATSADLSNVVSRFSCLNPARLLFTGLDEAVSSASTIETLIRSGIAASFIGTGQRIPDDLEEINADKLAWELWSDANLTSHFAQAAA